MFVAALPRLRSAYALTPNTFLAVLTFDDLLLLRFESLAIDHCVQVFAQRAAAKHPSLHPTVHDLKSHDDDDDLLPQPSLSAREISGTTVASKLGRAVAKLGRQNSTGDDQSRATPDGHVLLQTLRAQWEAEHQALDARMRSIEAGQAATQEMLSAIEKKLSVA